MPFVPLCTEIKMLEADLEDMDTAPASFVRRANEEAAAATNKSLDFNHMDLDKTPSLALLCIEHAHARRKQQYARELRVTRGEYQALARALGKDEHYYCCSMVFGCHMRSTPLLPSILDQSPSQSEADKKRKRPEWYSAVEHALDAMRKVADAREEADDAMEKVKRIKAKMAAADADADADAETEM